MHMSKEIDRLIGTVALLKEVDDDIERCPSFELKVFSAYRILEFWMSDALHLDGFNPLSPTAVLRRDRRLEGSF